MHVLTVIDHPNPDSFSHALAARFDAGAIAAGHSVERADLHAEGFDPRWRIEDAAQFEDGPSPRDVLDHQARIERCDAICLVFPMYWYGMPAMTKGWIDRVWSWGWAYDAIEDPPRSLQKPRAGVLLVPCAAAQESWATGGFDTAMRAIWGPGTLSFFGMAQPAIHFLSGAEGAPARRQSLLDIAYEAGRQL